MYSSAASKMLATAVDFTTSTASVTHRCPLTCLASAYRLVTKPPDLIQWVRREGGFVHPKLRIAFQGSDGLGLVAVSGITAGSDLITLPGHIPLQFQRSGEANGRDSYLIRLASKVPVELWAMKLGLRLLQERASIGSFWWPYISNLPETFTVPIFFSGKDIENLQYAPLVHQVNKRCRFLLQFDKDVKDFLEHVELKDHPFGGQDLNSSSLGWAMSAVSSRAFCLHGESNADGQRLNVPMLLPLIDMCNHSFHPNAKIFQEQEKGSSKALIKVVAEAQIEQDAPILLNYGSLSNDLFLLDYGFVVPSNPYDHVELKYDGTLLDAAAIAAGLSSPNFSSPAQWQKEILCQLNLLGEGATVKVSLGGSELVDGRLLAALRVLLSSKLEIVQSCSLETLTKLSEKAPLGVTIETTALRLIIALCVVLLEHFPTKVMQDEAVLKGSVSSSMALAVRYRIQKKLVIVDVMRKLSGRVQMLLKEKSL